MAMVLFGGIFVYMKIDGAKHGVIMEQMVPYYFLGTVISAVVLTSLFQIVPAGGLNPTRPLLMMLVVGIVFGGPANLLLFSSVGDASNPGLPMAVAGAAPLLTFYITHKLGQYMPSLPAMSYDKWHVVGVAITVIGVAMVVYERKPAVPPGG